jgi:ADP-ribosyl-[dinitrogen reductase] hydrolase
MALALVDSIASVGRFLNDQAGRYFQWWQHGEYSGNGRCFDIGNTTAAALQRFERLGDATISGDSSERASGNRSIMRLAPVPIRHRVSPETSDQRGFVLAWPDEKRGAG